MEYLIHPIDRELGIGADEALVLEQAEHGNDLGSSRALKRERIAASDGMSCPIRSFSHRRQNSSRLSRVTELSELSEAKMTSFLFQSLTTKNCSRWERSSAVFACRTLVITSRIALSSS
jgi:hypothetical protein